MVINAALLPWMDYPYAQRTFRTFSGLHGFADLKRTAKILFNPRFTNNAIGLKSFTFQIVFRAYSKLVIYPAVAGQISYSYTLILCTTFLRWDNEPIP